VSSPALKSEVQQPSAVSSTVTKPGAQQPGTVPSTVTKSGARKPGAVSSPDLQARLPGAVSSADPTPEAPLNLPGLRAVGKSGKPGGAAAATKPGVTAISPTLGTTGRTNVTVKPAWTPQGLRNSSAGPQGARGPMARPQVDKPLFDSVAKSSPLGGLRPPGKPLFSGRTPSWQDVAQPQAASAGPAVFTESLKATDAVKDGCVGKSASQSWRDLMKAKANAAAKVADEASTSPSPTQAPAEGGMDWRFGQGKAASVVAKNPPKPRAERPALPKPAETLVMPKQQAEPLFTSEGDFNLAATGATTQVADSPSKALPPAQSLFGPAPPVNASLRPRPTLPLPKAPRPTAAA